MKFELLAPVSRGRPLTTNEGLGAEVGKAVLIAALSALATGLVTWALDKVKQRVDPPKEKAGTSDGREEKAP